MLKIAWSEVYAHPVPEGHRFPMQKYDLIPQQLLHEGVITKENLFEPGIVAEEDLLLVHKREYWEKLKTGKLTSQEIRRIGLPFSEELVTRERIIMQGTVEAARYALRFGVSFNIAGGTHHAFADKGEGFCLLNDQAIAAAGLLRDRLAKRILIIDLDVHQGNGTAAIFEDWNEVFTFSMHGKNNFPATKEKSDLDIPLPDMVNDVTYLSILEENLPDLFHQFKPDFLFYQAGVDILETDALGKMKLTREGCKERDRIIFDFALKHKLPVQVSLGGGYSKKISEIVEAHCNTFRLAEKMFF